MRDIIKTLFNLKGTPVMDLIHDSIKIFTTIVEAGSLRKSAKILNIGNATASRKIKELEKHLGVSLFTQKSNNFKLTDSGMELYSIFKEQQQFINNKIHQFITSTPNNLLRVAIPVVFGYHIISKYIPDFIRKNPNIKLELYYHNHEINLFETNFDLAIINYHSNQKSLLTRRLLTVNVNLYCTPKYITKYGCPKDTDDLINNHLFIGHINHQQQPDIKNILHYTKIDNMPQLDKSNIRIFSNNAFHNTLMAQTDEAIIIGSDFTLRKELLNHELIKILENEAFGEISFHLIRKNEITNLSSNLFIDFINECIHKTREEYPDLYLNHNLR
ncbi:MAG: LysR family transcriptional regulator [Burkholderiales bacterium]|nr:LysR family transcriptional regulator [Burkholderiales bacterium]